MATIIVTGLILDVRNLENGKTAFTVSENTGTKETPDYSYYECLGSFSEKQVQNITKNKIVEVCGKFKSKLNEKDGNHYLNNNIYVYNLDFRGEAKKTQDIDQPEAEEPKKGGKSKK